MSLTLGAAQTSGGKALWINNMHGSEAKSGTQIMKEVIHSSINTPEYEGRVGLDAKWGSHLFHLKMGFCPADNQKVPVVEMCGMTSKMSLDDFLKYRGLFPVTQYPLDRSFPADSWVRIIMAIELNKTAASLTDAEINLNCKHLVSLAKDGVDRIDSFAYRLANSILSYRQGMPDAKLNVKDLTLYLKNSKFSLAAERMELSEAGLVRWKTAINAGEEFKPFRDLSHFFKKIKRPFVKELLKRAIAGVPGFVPLSMTEIKIKCVVPIGHALTIRGQGEGLDWNKGKPLQQIDDETHVYRIEGVSEKLEYKILLDDEQWENCPNHEIEAGKSEEFKPCLTFY